jgi:hypothetical protein
VQHRKLLFGLVALVAVAVTWFLFRPELLFVNKSVNEEFPSASSGNSELTARGEFHGVAHKSRGVATIHRLADGQHVLRFTEFETSNGPALHVYLVAADDATDNDTVKRSEIIDLGELKGNQGDQNYELPAGVELDRYRAVTIWCKRFSVNFATAPLEQKGS